MKKYLELIRVKHWIKNLLIFIPIISANAINNHNIINTIFAFLAFSFISSFIYIINDISDIEKDKLHPQKKNRPLPSGKISKKKAVIIAIIMIIISLLLNQLIFEFNMINKGLIFILSYTIINILYSKRLKNVAVIDVVLLASGFVLRVYYGASIINVEVSSWLFLTILNASFFLSLGKRRKEIQNAKSSRKVLQEYTEDYLKTFQYLNLALVFCFYSLWSVEQKVMYMYLTIPIVMIIFMKYSLVIEKSEEGDPTTILYKDKLLLALCIIYGIIMIGLLVIL